MTVNLGIDIAAGFFPGIDLLLDWAWKANKKNGELFRKHLNKARAEYQAIDPEGFADAQKRGLVALERVKIRNVLSGIKKLLQGK